MDAEQKDYFLKVGIFFSTEMKFPQLFALQVFILLLMDLSQILIGVIYIIIVYVCKG